MKRASAIIVIITSLIFLANSENISISGTITGNGGPISGARVTLKNNPDLVSFTNSSGFFSLNNTPVLDNKSTQRIFYATVRIDNNKIKISSIEKINYAEINIFDVAGKRLMSKKITSNGSNAVIFPLTAMSTQMSLLQLNIDNNKYTVKCLKGISLNLVSNTVSSRQSITNLKKNADVDMYVDSLIITARSWKNSIISLSGYNQTVNVELFASNPWKPAGELIHEKGMVKILAKGYDFEMGQAEVIHVDDLVYSEQPVHTVTFTYDFWMDTTEVTQKQFDELIRKNYKSYQVPSSRSSRYGIGDNVPAYYLYWDDAVMYCNLKSKEEGHDTVYTFEEIDGIPGEMCILFGVKSDITKNGYRLPTEAEWEYACRGGTATDFYWNKNINSYAENSSYNEEISKYAVWKGNSESIGENNPGYGIHEIATTLPNAYGLYEMAGNVSEHVHDFESLVYSYGSSIDPTGPQTGEIHLIRGGNWTNSAVYLRSASRNLSVGSYSYFCVGFRTVKTVK